ncbi:MAG: VanZ family protein [Methylococcales bacterium]
MKSYPLFAIVSIVSLVSLFLFIAPPDQTSSRSVKALWESGHIIGFAIWIVIIQNKWKKLATYPVFFQISLLLLISLLLGILIELLQTFIAERIASPMDVVRDIAGSLFAIAFFNSQLQKTSTLHKTSIKVLASSVVIFVLIPLFSVAADDILANSQFPVIADFESPFELSRIESSMKVALDEQLHHHGKRSMKVVLEPARYSGFHLRAFPRNWRPFNSLKFSIFNHANYKIYMTCRISDINHNHSHGDRFNRKFAANPGWNHISIPLTDVNNAPINRKMDMTAIKHIGIFITALDKPVEVNIDYIRLSKE